VESEGHERRDLPRIRLAHRGRPGRAIAAQRDLVVVHGEPGSVDPLHEGLERSNEAILRVVDELQGRGYSFVIPGDEQLV